MDYMARALDLASRALGTCSPNPAVGAVLVRDGAVVGEGVTQPPGQAHAEVVALTAAGPRARGATLYVTLEPCVHYGRTAPCTEAILAAGVSDVSVAMLDPSPWVDGRGRAALEQAGVRVRLGAHEREARRLNEAYLTWVLHGRPLVTALYALNLDGHAQRLADAALDPKAAAELDRLRARADMTVSAAETLLLEDPTLSNLASTGVRALNVESTPVELGPLLAAGLLDRVLVFVTPTFGANDSALSSQLSAPHTLTLQRVTQERLGGTMLVSGYLPDAAPLDADDA
jgi:diaminohydroxyphosphoribosylaminopyrimidine deaminase / 5-amino-6-(5-phosphoribosylamino)uracil reductase